jgi:hypothetical protein
MKKTIAILLVLVIGMAGVFAVEGNALLNIATTVSSQSLIKVTNTSTGAYDFSDFVFYTFAGLDDSVNSDVTITESNFSNTDPITVGYLNYWSNETTGLTTTISASVLKDRTEETSNTSTIGYGVYLDSNLIVTVLNSEETATAASATTLITSNAATSTSGSKAIKVKVEANDYRLALASDDYTATITFNYTAN